MFTELHLKDFQGHADSLIEFDKGVNAFIGETDQGKSSVIRGIRLVVENKPAGNSFIRNGTPETIVSLTTDDAKVVRQKSKTSHKYILNGVELKAFGQGVPDEVTAVMRIDPDINIQRQSSPYFLLHSSEAERGKLLDKFCNIAIASQSVAIARRNALRADKQAGEYQDRLKPLEAKQAALRAFLAYSRVVDRLVEKGDELEVSKREYTTVSNLREKLCKLTARTPSKLVVPVVPDVGKLYERLNYLTACKKAISRVIPSTIIPNVVSDPAEQRVLLARLQAYKKVLDCKVPSRIGYHHVSDPVEQRALLVRLSAYKKALAVSVPRALEYSDDSCHRLTALSTKLAKVRALSATLASMDTDLIAARQEALEVQEALAKWEVCPLCQQPIGGHTHV
jgi:DNA repair ATPase RecN